MSHHDKKEGKKEEDKALTTLFERPPLPTKWQVAEVAISTLCCGLRWFPPASLDPQKIFAYAKSQTGLTDFGGETEFEGFRRVVLCLKQWKEEGRLGVAGYVAASMDLTRCVMERMGTLDLYNKKKASEQKIVQPIYITGLMRCGTTLLHHLLCRNTRMQNVKAWEMWHPSRDEDYAQRQSRFKISLMNSLVPRLQSIHPVVFDNPEECMLFMDLAFESVGWCWRYGVHAYQDWLEGVDQRSAYDFHKKCFQLLQLKHLEKEREKDAKAQPKQWVLKSPSHVGQIRELLEVYPDAHVIWLHREPIESVASCCSLWAYTQSAWVTELDAKKLGEYCCRYWSHSVARSLKALNEKNRDSILHISYKTLVKDPIGTARKVYQYFGISRMDENLEKEMKSFLAATPQHKHGKHVYSLAQFGLTKEKLREDFAEYYARFIDTDENTNLDAQIKRKYGESA